MKLFLNKKSWKLNKNLQKILFYKQFFLILMLKTLINTNSIKLIAN